MSNLIVAQILSAIFDRIYSERGGCAGCRETNYEMKMAEIMKKWKKIAWIKGAQGERGWFDACNANWCICNPYPSQMSDLFLNFGINIIFAFAKILISYFILLWNCHGCGGASKLLFGRIFFQSQLVVTTWYQHITQTQ